jgi:Leucine-rich repeat (LRR) protein
MHMQILHAERNKLLSVGALGHMVDLSVLVLSGNQLEDISALNNCIRLTELRVDNNLLTSIDCIAKMPDLTYFDCSYNQVEGIPELDPLSRLQQFYASYNQIPSVAPLAGLPELTYVNVDYNEPIDDIEILSSCRLLVQVNAFGTHVKEVKMLTDFGVIVNFDPSFADQNTAE